MPPREQLQQSLPDLAIPEDWDPATCLDLVSRFDRNDRDPLVTLLASLSDRDQAFWNDSPSLRHLATWLETTLDPKFAPLTAAWLRRHPHHILTPFYRTPNKLDLLRQWLGISPTPAPPELKSYPLPIPAVLRAEFTAHWDQQLRTSGGTCLDTINPHQQCGIDLIAQRSFLLFEQSPAYLNPQRHQKLRSHLSHRANQQLTTLTAPPKPAPLPPAATPDEALRWATQDYLPYRRWEMVVAKLTAEQGESTAIADSFVTWIYDHYPILKVTPVAESSINYHATHEVLQLTDSSPVLWVVIDGLGWLDHTDLLAILADQDLVAERDPQPLFSLLPTLTKYAKWGLYAQQTPIAERWKDTVVDGFKKIGIGQYYPDSQEATLIRDIQAHKHNLYCWDTTRLDEVYHSRGDWENTYNIDRQKELEAIAGRIQRLVNSHPHRETLRVAIASDHGQLLGRCPGTITAPPTLSVSGRVAYGATDDQRFLTLTSDRFDLPQDISVVRSAASHGRLSYTDGTHATGFHGGLFPEEVVVGFSVLRLNVQRQPISVCVQGAGEAGKPTTLTLTLDNPNPVTLTNLALTIHSLGLMCDRCLNASAPPGKSTYQIDLPTTPDLPPNSDTSPVPLDGTLTFNYTAAESAQMPLTHSFLDIHQVYSSGFDINEFL